MSRWELKVLGPTVVSTDGEDVPLRPRELHLLTLLAIARPEPLTLDAIGRSFWPSGSPPSARQTIQNHVARVRARLRHDAISTVAGGYELGSGWSIDAERFDADVARAREASLAGDWALACTFLRTALDRTRGDAYSDLDLDLDLSVTVAARTRRREAQLAAEDELVLALLANGDVAAGLVETSSLVDREPSRESRWLALALAQYRHGERRESLLTLQRARSMLLDTAGLDAGPALARLERLILDDDATLLHAAPGLLTGQSPVPHLHDGTAVLVGRVEESAAVRHRLEQVIRDRSAVWIDVAGPPGIGKSAFGERFATQAMIGGWHVVSARCYPAGLRLLEPFGEVVRQIVAHEAHPTAAFEPQVLTDLGLLWRAQPFRPPRGDLGEAVVDVIVSHAERSPTLIVIDDAHHLSETARRLLIRLRSVGVPIVIATIRSDEAVPDDRFDLRLVLGGLDAAECRRLLEVQAGRTVSEREAERIHVVTGGSPLLLAHIARGGSLPDEAAARRAGGIGGQILLESLRRMSPEVNDVAALLAVAGGPMVIDTIAGALGATTAATAATVDDGLAGGVLRAEADGRPDLISGMLRDALLGGTDDGQRIDLHERLGSAIIAAGGDPLLAAPHLLAAAEHDPDRAVLVAHTAAERAGAATMHIEAAALLDAAAVLAAEHLGDAAATTLRLRLERAEHLRRAGDASYLEVVWNVVRAADAVGDDEALARGAIGLCQLGPLTAAGTLDRDVAELVERAIAGCRTPAVRARCAAQASLFYSMSGRIDLCRAHFQDALEHARAAGDDGTLLDVLTSVYIALNHPDDWELASELAGELLGLAEQLDDDDARFAALHLYFAAQVQFGDPLLRTTFAAQEALAATLRSTTRRWMLGYQAAALAHLDGRLDDALRIGTETFGGALVAESRVQSVHWMNMLVVRLAEGRGQELADDIDVVVATQPGLPGWRAVAAWLAALRGDRERVLHECDVLDRGAALPRDMSWSGAAMLLGRAVATTGNGDRVAALRTLLGPYTGLMTWIGSCTVGPFDVALAELALADGDVAGAARHLASAQHIVDRLRAPVFQSDLDHIGQLLA